MNQLKDIKPIVAISDNSLVYLLIIVFIAILIAIFFYWKTSASRRNDKRKIAAQKLQNLDFSDSKKTAYSFKKYAEYLCNHDNKDQLKQINQALMQYKYKKQVAELDPVLIEKIKDFINAEL
jgi:lipopolysaccharide export LptBFGC system permease protein LptF